MSPATSRHDVVVIGAGPVGTARRAPASAGPRRPADLRATVGERVHARMNAIGAGDADAPAQLKIVAQTPLMAVINHEYQHDRWIGEVRDRDLGHALPDAPISDRLATVDGYLVVRGWNV